MTESSRSALRAMAHPLRLRMLSLLTGAELSAAEVARELEITHANASYHLRVLLAAGLVVIAGEEKIRGGVAKRYHHPWRASLQSTPLGEAEDQELFVRSVAAELVRRYPDRTAGRRCFSDAELWVDADSYARAVTVARELTALLHGSALPPRSPGAVRANLTLALFPMADGTAP